VAICAQLQGARLNNAELQGASLISSQLQGTSLEGASLQGADFGGSALVGTNLRNATVWRTTFDGASLTSVYEDGLKETALSKGEFAALKAKLMEEMPKGENREQALKRIETLNPDTNREESVQETLKNGRAKNETEYRSAMAITSKASSVMRTKTPPISYAALLPMTAFWRWARRLPALSKQFSDRTVLSPPPLRKRTGPRLKERQKWPQGPPCHSDTPLHRLRRP